LPWIPKAQVEVVKVCYYPETIGKIKLLTEEISGNLRASALHRSVKEGLGGIGDNSGQILAKNGSIGRITLGIEPITVRCGVSIGRDDGADISPGRNWVVNKLTAIEVKVFRFNMKLF